MATLRIRKDNPSGRTEDVLDVFGEKLKVSTTQSIEVSDSDVRMLCINPTLYDGVPESPKQKAEPKADKPKKKK